MNFFSNGGAIATDIDCSSQFQGNKTEFCGGTSLLSVYNFNNTLNSTLPTTTLPTTTSSPGIPSTTPAAPSIVGSYNYCGCETEATIGRALTSNSTATDSMTLEYCAVWCAGYNIFGTEYGRECNFQPVSIRWNLTN